MAKIVLIRWDREVTGAPPSGTEISEGIREQEAIPPWTLRKRQQNRREHCPAVRLLIGSSSGGEGQMQPHADVPTVVPDPQIEARCFGVKPSSEAGEGEAVAAAAERGEALTAEIGFTASGPEERPAGRLSCCMASSGTHLSGAWATPRTSPGSRFATPTWGRARRPGATKCSSTEGKSDWENTSTRECLMSA